MLLGIFHFERVATPRVDTAMKRGSNILCPIKEKNVRFPSKISFFSLVCSVVVECLTLIAGKMCESLCLIRYTTVTKNVKSVKGKERRSDFDFEVRSLKIFSYLVFLLHGNFHSSSILNINFCSFL